jgi:3-hydroxybutyryl-CoA dehydratase
MLGKSIAEIRVGDKAQLSKTISESDVYLYAGITGDFNPAHINEEYAEQTHFKSRIAHGLLSAGFISATIGTILPGPGTIYLKQELTFSAPVHIGDTITASVKVVEVNVEKNHVVLKTTCKNQKGEPVIEGQAVVSPPKTEQTEKK